MLSPLQRRLAEIVAGLPEAAGFALAGAGALSVHGFIDRPTRDLDFFTTPREQAGVQRLAASLEGALAAEGMSCVRRRDLPSFVRIEVVAGADRCEVDLAIDYRALDVVDTALGPTLAPRELAANKVLAVFDRAEPRDFTDLDALTGRFPLTELLELAARKDTGFDTSRFVQALRSFHRFNPTDLDVTPAEHARLRTVFDGWAQQLERRLTKDRDGIDRGLDL